MSKRQNRNTVFPDGPNDGDVFFHGQMVFEYHSSTNTWEGWRHNREDQLEEEETDE